MILFENDKRIDREPRTIKEAKEMIAGLDYAGACVDADPQSYVLKNAKGRIVYERPGYRIP